MDETLYIAHAETTELLNCYIVGWKHAVRQIEFQDWIWWGNQGGVAHLGWHTE